MNNLQGIIPPVITPLTQTGDIDPIGLARLLNHLNSGGVHGLFILGTTGEGPALGMERQKEMIRQTMRLNAKALPVLLIGTTAGTGSEVTGVSVLTNSSTGKKESISGADCYAAVSFCDYSYTVSAPPAVTVSTALDAFAHAAESYLASSANDLSRAYAARAFTLLRPFLCGLGSDAVPDEAQREALYAASIYAGLAINISGTCFPHTVGYYLTETYGVPHGLACIAFLPELLRRAKKYCPETLGAMENDLGLTARELAALLAKVVRFDVSASAQEAASALYPAQIKNFTRSPGGFTADDAKAALAAFRSDFPL